MSEVGTACRSGVVVFERPSRLVAHLPTKPPVMSVSQPRTPETSPAPHLKAVGSLGQAGEGPGRICIVASRRRQLAVHGRGIVVQCIKQLDVVLYGRVRLVEGDAGGVGSVHRGAAADGSDARLVGGSCARRQAEKPRSTRRNGCTQINQWLKEVWQRHLKCPSPRQEPRASANSGSLLTHNLCAVAWPLV